MQTVLLGNVPILSECSQQRLSSFIKLGEGEISLAASDMQRLGEMVRADCAALITEMAGLFDRLGGESNGISKSLKGIHRADAYKCLEIHLRKSSDQLMSPHLVRSR